MASMLQNFTRLGVISNGKPSSSADIQTRSIRISSDISVGNDLDSNAPQWLYPSRCRLPHRQKVTYADVAKVSAIRDEAMSKGWSEVALFQNQSQFTFPFGHEYGLVCFLGEGREIKSISQEFISIVHHEANGRDAVLHFLNPASYQPKPKENKPDTKKAPSERSALR